jgi:hypothetical protein
MDTTDVATNNPITHEECDWMLSGLNLELSSLQSGDPRSESLGHATFLWSEVKTKLDANEAIFERPTLPLGYI